MVLEPTLLLVSWLTRSPSVNEVSGKYGSAYADTSRNAATWWPKQETGLKDSIAVNVKSSYTERPAERTVPTRRIWSTHGRLLSTKRTEEKCSNSHSVSHHQSLIIGGGTTRCCADTCQLESLCSSGSTLHWSVKVSIIRQRGHICREWY